MSDLEAWARGLLRCPSCGATLRDVLAATGAPTLACEGAEVHVFPVREGIPVLLIDEMLTGPVGEQGA